MKKKDAIIGGILTVTMSYLLDDQAHGDVALKHMVDDVVIYATPNTPRTCVKGASLILLGRYDEARKFEDTQHDCMRSLVRRYTLNR